MVIVVADSLLVIRETYKGANAVCWARILGCGRALHDDWSAPQQGSYFENPKRLESKSLWIGDLKTESFILTRCQCQKKG